jgi:mannose-6-phosphate isomerase-like protein (cupin superfamily)
MHTFHLTPEAAQQLLEEQAGSPFAILMKHGTMQVEYFQPVGTDKQEPHAQDELYFIAAGNSRFERNGEVVSVNKGDVLFVPAGMPHRFIHFSADFATWVVFYGPQGGEIKQ